MHTRTVCRLVTIAAAAIAGCSHSTGAEDEQARTKRAMSEIPKLDEIFAITLWTPASPTPAALIKKATTTKATQPTRERAPWGSTKAEGTCWLLLWPQGEYWKDRYKVTPTDVRKMLKTYHRVSLKQWKNVSHVAGGDLGGWLILNDGRCVQWMMKPGGLGWLRSASGEMIYLSMTPPSKG